MTSNHLKLNSDKTQIIWLGSRQQIKKIKFTSVPLGSDTVSFQSSVNNLDVVFDNELSMGEHILRLCRTLFNQLRQLCVIRQSLTYETCIILVHAFVNSRLDCCNSLLFGASSHLISRLQSPSARFIFQKRKCDRISDDIWDKLH